MHNTEQANSPVFTQGKVHGWAKERDEDGFQG